MNVGYDVHAPVGNICSGGKIVAWNQESDSGTLVREEGLSITNNSSFFSIVYYEHEINSTMLIS